MGRFGITAHILLCFGHFVWAEIKQEYFVVDQSITLRPPPGTTVITGILWKHNDNMVAEWTEDDANVEYYADFKNRTTLNTATGELAITPATQADAGVYTVEINNKLLDYNYEVKSVQEVPTPFVWVKPGSSEDEHKLTCEGDVSKAGPVQFLWSITEDMSWVELGYRVTLQNNETTRRIQSFSCKLVNVAGEKESKSVENPFYPKQPDMSGLGALVLLPIAALAAFLTWKYKEDIKKRLCGEGGDAAVGAASQAVPLQSGGEK